MMKGQGYVWKRHYLHNSIKTLKSESIYLFIVYFVYKFILPVVMRQLYFAQHYIKVNVVKWTEQAKKCYWSRQRPRDLKH